MVRLAAQLPFRQAARECEWFLGVAPSAATVRRMTEAAGAAQVASEEADRLRLEQVAPPSPPGPAVQQVSVDGAMVPLVGGEWAEVKTVAIGTVTSVRPTAAGTPPVQTDDWSYFSRLADAETFSHAALVELHRRGTFAAGTVVAPVDGSAWCQGFYDLHRPDAVRILDFPHAGEHLSAPARAIWGQGSATTQAWVDAWLPQLKTGDPAEVLAAVCQLPVEAAGDAAAAAAVRAATVAYLASRWDQIQYATFLAQGYPIGSGSVESANKLVVEARLKGSGMHWARPHVTPMLALRNVVCNDRWAEAWPQMVGQQRQAVAAQRRARHEQRRAAHLVPALPTPPSTAPPAAAAAPSPTVVPHRAPCVVAGRPTAAHPWKRRPFRDLPDRHRLPPSAKR
jgi:hypothetical protein